MCCCLSVFFVSCFELIMSYKPENGKSVKSKAKKKIEKKTKKKSKKKKAVKRITPDKPELTWDDVNLSNLGQSDLIDLLINRNIDYDGHITKINQPEEVILANEERLRNLLRTNGIVTIHFNSSMALGAECRLRCVFFYLNFCIVNDS